MTKTGAQTTIEKNRIDDVFSFRNKEVFLLATVVIAIISFAYSMSLNVEIGEGEKESYRNIYLINQLAPLYEQAEKIEKKPQDYKIDYLEADSLLLMIDKVKLSAQKIGMLNSLTIATMEMQGTSINILKISIAGETSLDKYHKTIEEYASYGILTKYSYNGDSALGRYVIEMSVYYKGVLPADYQKKELNPDELSKIEKEIDDEAERLRAIDDENDDEEEVEDVEDDGKIEDIVDDKVEGESEGRKMPDLSNLKKD